MGSVKIIELNETNTCKICDNALARYSCPRCNILYCSLTCYQANSHLQCSETFYKENVMSELDLDKNSTDYKTKMLEILQRTHENNMIPSSEEMNDFENYADFENFDQADSDDDPDFEDIADRLAGVDLDDAEQVWDKLTEDEKQEFVAFLKSEDVTKLIPSWQPWWLYHSENKVQDISEEETFKTNCPKVLTIKDFSQITTKPPSECVKYNLINVLSAYVFTTRYFNGEHFEFAKEAVSCIASLSGNLKEAQNFEDFDTAIKHVEQECCNSTWILTDAENIQVMREDIRKILMGPNDSENKFYILSALSDLRNLLEESLKPEQEANTASFNKRFPNDHFPAVKFETPDKTRNYIKKIDYYLSYTKDYYSP
ncbi:hypothetical protein NQ318_001977 [Aromia moschata]|uniref:HIT-type domain-containing protein n=1 Tax=Aromia moschata TaxID=1265417 RepID=A0AAV8Z4A6_9CUCU|nr:hypothetical protein NQ318_001977 [Aromia moschata]